MEPIGVKQTKIRIFGKGCLILTWGGIIYSFTMFGLKSCLVALVSSSAYSAYRPVICKDRTNGPVYNLFLFFYPDYNKEVMGQLLSFPPLSLERIKVPPKVGGSVP